jgi:MRM3-like substrate binding domain
MPNETNSARLADDAQSTLDEIKRLQADRTHRDARRAFFVEGVRNVVQAIENGFPIETLERVMNSTRSEERPCEASAC